ncbi:MAG: SGNH/GDSL hydrolase family protein [Candidatus Glassbacteria bacterium]
MRNRLIVLACFIFALFVNSARAEQPFFIQDGDVVLFWGNSITDYGVYPRLVENYVLTHHPDWKVQFFNLGWGGDRAANVDRLRRDLQLCQPTKVTVMLGMNDAGYGPFDPKLLSVYLDSLKTEIEILRRRSNPEILLISPSLYELRCIPQVTRGALEEKQLNRMGSLLYPQTLERFSYELGQFAGREGLKFYDLNYSSARASEELAGYDGNFMFTAESVHPTVDGQLQMGLEILRAMGAASLVAETAIDAAAGSLTGQTDCSVTGLKASPRAVSFTRKAARLPLPIYPSTAKLMRTVMDWPESWDRDIVRVAGLEAGWYRIAVDSREITVVSNSQLAGGVNLSRWGHTPQMIQAYKVFEQTERRMAAFWTRWRRVLLEGVGGPGDFTQLKTGVDTGALEAAERAAFEAQHRLNQPVDQRYEITPAEHPALRPSPYLPASGFLEDMVRVFISVDSRTLPEFKPPLVLRGNFSYAPQYGWGIVEEKGYYANIPVALYDDGTRGDKVAGDGTWSIEMYLRKGSGKLWFGVWDGEYLLGYWNALHPDYFRNHWCQELTQAWGDLLGRLNERGAGIYGIPLDGDVSLVWDVKAFEQAEKNGKIYRP